MASGRDAFGNLIPITYGTSYDTCACGRSAFRAGCGKPAVVWFRRLSPCTGPVAHPLVVGICADHADEYRRAEYPAIYIDYDDRGPDSAAWKMAPEYEEVPRPEGESPSVIIW